MSFLGVEGCSDGQPIAVMDVFGKWGSCVSTFDIWACEKVWY